MSVSNTDINLPQILYEDNHILAVNKKASQLVQGDKTGDTSLDDTIKKFLKEKYNKPGRVFLGVVHRIDRPVSGVTLFAKTSKSLARLNNLFKEGKIKKTYWAITKNSPPGESGFATHYLKRNTKQNKSYAYNKPVAGSKEAKLSYRLIYRFENYFLLEIDLITGRHHQIRCQLAKMNSPVKGDLKYGFPRSNPGGGISLHSRQMVFEHPVKKNTVIITAPPPDENLWKVFAEQTDYQTDAGKPDKNNKKS